MLRKRSFAGLRISAAGSRFAHACGTPQIKIRGPERGVTVRVRPRAPTSLYTGTITPAGCLRLNLERLRR
jgi:hypothetical protein